MGIRWDALLVREVARELNDKLARARLRAVRFDGNSRDAILFFREATVVWRLHPDRGTVSVHEPRDPGADALPLASRVRRIHAPADERLIVFELIPVRGRRQASDLVVELLGNQWNCLIAEGEAGILRHVLHTRTGKRLLRVGQPYQRPAASDRLGADSIIVTRTEWAAWVGNVPPEERAKSLVSGVAWTSPLNVKALLPPSESPSETDPGFALWRQLAEGSALTPCLLRLERGDQPYPVALPGVQYDPVESLLAAFTHFSEGDEGIGSPESTLVDPHVLRRLEKEIESAERRGTSLVAELDSLEDPEKLRAVGDLLLARYHDIPTGVESATIEDFEGNPVVVQLDPGAPAHKNAAAYYDRAAKTDRALKRLPAMIEAAKSDASDFRDLLLKASAGLATSEEIEARLPAARVVRAPKGEEESLPYRRYTSSGGIEIRVGRGAKHNDALTFHHAAPNDVWLHARHTAGAHVVLRWSGPGNPPGRDLEEAAILAALHSKARTSGSVPVDYTLRKYVRKPRGAASGAVLPDRVKTLFVRPDPEVAERLADA